MESRLSRRDLLHRTAALTTVIASGTLGGSLAGVMNGKRAQARDGSPEGSSPGGTASTMNQPTAGQPTASSSCPDETQPQAEAHDEKASSDERLPIIDTHQHLWNLKRFNLPWLKGGGPLARDYSMTDFLAATSGLNVVKTIYMEVDVDPREHPREAEYVIGQCRDKENPMVAAVIGGRPADDAFRQYMARYQDNALVTGVRQVLHGPTTPRGYCLEQPFIEGIRLLGTLGKSFDICIRPGELSDAATLAKACPDTPLILDHCGNVSTKQKNLDAWRRDLAALARHKQVACKISGQMDKAPTDWTPETLAPVVNHCLDVFGPKRVVFGGDWPVCTLGGTYRRWVDSLMTILADRPVAQQRMLLHDNALRIYRLAAC
jgi:predicted TIM-barrel fold metal-dependent hydrolase